MKHFFMSYSHPVLTTTIVSLPGPHVSHHQWDPNVADKIISLPLCCSHIPPLLQSFLCLPFLGESYTQTTTSLCVSVSPSAPAPIPLSVFSMGSFPSGYSWAPGSCGPVPVSWHKLLALCTLSANVYGE
ncbi:unnamed protein product [Gulo gulo]|uniref:Uncharacterized protein n=1 Tax=Gulo gulo TaxID=48420 RepID=A0A9X9PXC5_GULGU|nr:unnamed protein product [Gulo gulo]